MRNSLLVPLTALLLLSVPAIASEKTDAMAAVHLFVDNMDKGDMQAAASAYAPDSSIIDEFPPHAWHGATAFADWGKDFGTWAQGQGVSEPILKLGKPKHIDITGDRAYVVIAADFSFKQHGRRMHEPGSYMTFALHKLDAGWRITAWSWTRPGAVVHS